MQCMGADPTRVCGSGPHKNLVVESSMAWIHENFTEINLISTKLTAGAAL